MIIMHIKNHFLINFILLLGIHTYAFSQPDVVDEAKYPFIHFTKNKIYEPDTLALNNFFTRFQSLLTFGDRQLNIIHFGDSHIQADWFSGRMRDQLQNFIQGGNGGRGFVFPYSVAHTNNPYNYKITATGNWTNCRSIQYGVNCPLGLAGYSITTSDSFVTLSIYPTNFVSTRYDYNRIRLYYECGDKDLDISLTNIDSGIVAERMEHDGVAEWNLTDAVKTFDITIRRTDSVPHPLTIYGLALETDDPGIIYHSAGVNGAEVISLLRCNLLARQVQSLNPDMLIFSFGTNDAYGKNFNKDTFANRYHRLIEEARKYNPDIPVIITTPGDNYHGRYMNPNNDKAEEAIFSLANKYGYCVWDFYDVMGGLGSMSAWMHEGLAGSDKVHLTKAGYQLQGDLFFEAFVRSFDDYLNKRK